MSAFAWPRSKFMSDSFYNALSVLLLAAAGISTNALIAGAYGASALGVFSQTYAVYIFGAHLACMGMHASVLKHIPEHSGDEQRQSEIFTSALALITAQGLMLCAVMWLAREALARLFDSDDMVTALTMAIPGLFAFALNKFLLNVLNGLSAMKAYACISSARYILLLATVLLFLPFNVNAPYLPLALTISEILTFVILLLYVWRRTALNIAPSFTWIKRHVSFGLRSAPGCLAMEINPRVDIVMLGYFASDSVVGVYSFMSMITIGLIQFPFVLRKVFDPDLTRMYYARQYTELKRKMKRLVAFAFFLMLALSAAALALYKPLVLIIIRSPELVRAYEPLAVLLVGLVVFGAYIPVTGTLIQCGRPELQTMLVFATVTSNGLLNIVLIPHFEMLGAAVATGLSYCITIALMRYMIHRHLGLNANSAQQLKPL